jgi:hypothetical protein
MYQLVGISAFGTEGALIDRTFGLAFDIDDLAALGIDVLAAPDRAVRTYAVAFGRAAKPGMLGHAVGAEGLRAVSGHDVASIRA